MRCSHPRDDSAQKGASLHKANSFDKPEITECNKCVPFNLITLSLPPSLFLSSLYLFTATIKHPLTAMLL